MQEKKNYSQLRAMKAIAVASFRSIIRNPSAVVFSIAFPLVFIVAFGFINGNSIKMEVGIDPQSDTTGTIYHSFINSPNVELKTQFTAAELNERLNRGRIDAVLKFDKASSTNTEVVEIITSQASREKGMFVRSLVTNLIDKQNIEYYKNVSLHVDSSIIERARETTKPTELRETKISGREYKMIDFILPGQLGFSILSAAVFGTAFVFFSLRQTMVLKRFFATPIRRPYIILGEALSRLIFQLLGSSVIIVIGHFVFGFTLINGIWTALEMLLLSALGLIVFMGFGFVVSGIAKSENVIPPIANIITLPQFLLCGTFFPIDAFPKWLQIISKALPLTYLNDALRMIAFEGAGLMDISSQLLVLVLWGVVVYAAAIRFFRWE
ncbi:MAG TPA: ABC transporter permease [Bacteroidia bacterium]|nr:ABC transporter permease [Bacteroidota bacterium]HQW23147.1 ABC transporter permease [Bacteroidia bacterium]